MKSKYRSISTVVDGIRFNSKKEAKYYSELKIRKAVGEVTNFLMQTTFHLPGGVKYRVDFQEFHEDGSVHFVDVKGFETQAFKIKKKQVEHLYYPIKIEVI